MTKLTSKIHDQINAFKFNATHYPWDLCTFGHFFFDNDKL
jgi:hypothetical protein